MNMQPTRPCRVWCDLGILLLTAVFAFVIGNHAPPMRAWQLPVFAGPLGEPEPPASKPDRTAELAAEWRSLRDQAEQKLETAQTVLRVMQSRKLTSADVQAQQQKVDRLKKERDDYEERLQELTDADPKLDHTSPAVRHEINVEELHIRHRRWLDQARLQRAVRAQ
jgi:multidrug efflux pump subunit AcrA (membrane-fusion protein)